MNWSNAQNLIITSITKGLKLDPKLQYRNVIDVPPFKCFRNGYKGGLGFRIDVGRNSIIEIPMEVLEEVYFESITHRQNKYNKLIFRYCFNELYELKPCYVHTVGKIFTNSNLAKQISKTEYLFF